MSCSKNWKAYYTQNDIGNVIIIEGEIKAALPPNVIPGIRRREYPSLDTHCLNVEIINTGNFEYKEIKEVFFLDTKTIETILVYCEDGLIEAVIPVSSHYEEALEDLLHGEFYDD